jgi:hypothetical protein
MMLYYATVKAQKEGASDTVEAVSQSKKAVDDGSVAGMMEALKIKQFDLYAGADPTDGAWNGGKLWNFYMIHESKESFEAIWAGREKAPLFQALAKDTADTLEHPNTVEHQAMVMECVFQCSDKTDAGPPVEGTCDPIEGASKEFIEIHVKEEKAGAFSEKMEAFAAANKDGISQFDVGKNADRRGYSKEKLDQGPKKLADGSNICGIYARGTQETMDALKAMLKAEKTDLGITYYDGQE